jgi:hypothetical protein
MNKDTIIIWILIYNLLHCDRHEYGLIEDIQHLETSLEKKFLPLAQNVPSQYNCSFNNRVFRKMSKLREYL